MSDVGLLITRRKLSKILTSRVSKALSFSSLYAGIPRSLRDLTNNGALPFALRSITAKSPNVGRRVSSPSVTVMFDDIISRILRAIYEASNSGALISLNSDLSITANSVSQPSAGLYGKPTCRYSSRV